ncbi:replication protein A 70 kDa DNA-binding subunit B-like [Arachis ipaensis]|uniref:replication protein A 70 kDa DNA-binding subunit B-like n=1 Tax=Arachis ipaensis TaxID=130454 RepID=UPI0007AF84C0|nr:replication protein A 70 kDa DNA-binding subunit B-like [Arachis ipaensis]
MDATNEICMVSTDSQQCLRNITPWKEYWKITVRVIRMWSSCDPREETDEPAFLHIVVMDKSLNKIQCTLKNVINQFREILKEGELYSISRFTVVPNIGAAKVIKHRYKLLFRFDTEVIPISDVEFPEGSYSLETVESVVQMGQDSVYLIDVMGFLISVRDYSDVELDDGKKFKLVLIQLYSNGSYLTCNLFGDFLTKMRLALMNAVSQPPIILLQSVKVKIYEGKVVVQNVIDCTKIMINPDIPEAICFITRLDPSESYFIDSITLGNGFIVADVNDDFVNLSE